MNFIGKSHFLLFNRAGLDFFQFRNPKIVYFSLSFEPPPFRFVFTLVKVPTMRGHNFAKYKSSAPSDVDFSPQLDESKRERERERERGRKRAREREREEKRIELKRIEDRERLCERFPLADSGMLTVSWRLPRPW